MESGINDPYLYNKFFEPLDFFDADTNFDGFVTFTENENEKNRYAGYLVELQEALDAEQERLEEEEADAAAAAASLEEVGDFEMPTEFEIVIAVLEANGIDTTLILDMDAVNALDLTLLNISEEDLMNFDLLDDDDFEALFGITHAEYDMLMQMDFSDLPADFDYDTYEWEELDEAKLPKNFDWNNLSND